MSQPKFDELTPEEKDKIKKEGSYLSKLMNKLGEIDDKEGNYLERMKRGKYPKEEIAEALGKKEGEKEKVEK